MAISSRVRRSSSNGIEPPGSVFKRLSFHGVAWPFNMCRTTCCAVADGSGRHFSELNPIFFKPSPPPCLCRDSPSPLFRSSGANEFQTARKEIPIPTEGNPNLRGGKSKSPRKEIQIKSFHHLLRFEPYQGVMPTPRAFFFLRRFRPQRRSPALGLRVGFGLFVVPSVFVLVSPVSFSK
jgi:hypothetical protein